MRMTNVRLLEFLIQLHFTQRSRRQCCPVSCTAEIHRVVSSAVNEAWRSSEQVKVKSLLFLVKFGTDANPLKSLSGELDRVSNAAV